MFLSYLIQLFILKFQLISLHEPSTLFLQDFSIIRKDRAITNNNDNRLMHTSF